MYCDGQSTAPIILPKSALTAFLCVHRLSMWLKQILNTCDSAKGEATDMRVKPPTKNIEVYFSPDLVEGCGVSEHFPKRHTRTQKPAKKRCIRLAMIRTQTLCGEQQHCGRRVCPAADSHRWSLRWKSSASMRVRFTPTIANG